MAITVAATTTAVVTSVVRPTASISVVVPQVGVAYAVPVSSVAYIALSVAEELDVTGRYRFIADAQVVVDATALSPEKLLGDTLAPQASHLSFALAKPFSDTQEVTDTLVAAVSKIVADSYGVPDAAVHELTKAAFDAFPLTDDSIYALNKFLADGVAMNDAFDATDGSLYSIAKYFMNVAFVDETLRRDVDKALVDAVLASEAKAIDFVKAPFTETLAPPTDFSFLVAQLTKADAAAVGDAAVLDLTKPLSDVFTYAEFLQHELTKPLSDVSLAGDMYAAHVTKPFAAAANASDAPVTRVISKYLGDSVVLVDVAQATIVVIRDFTDPASVPDSLTAVVTKPTSDAVANADTSTYAISKLLADGFALNDMADVGDGITFSFGQTVANVALIADNSTRQPQLGKAEAISAADSGSLINQGYCDLTYFAEDYVGATRSF